MENSNEEIIDVDFESINQEEILEKSNKKKVDVLINDNVDEKEVEALIKAMHCNCDTRSVLNKSRDIILTSYDITSTANKIYNFILYKVQKSKNGHYKCRMKSNEIRSLIKKNDNKNIDGIKDILSMLKATSLLFWDKEENKEVENDYNLITGRKYIPEDDIFEIEVPDVVYKHITKYKCYAPLNLDILSQFKSFYAQRMYELLRLWSRYNIEVEHKFTLEELRFVLGVGDRYPRYTNFKQKVLMVCKKELKEKANMDIEFLEVKTGRKTTHIIIKMLDKEIKKYFSYKKIEELRKIDLIGLSDEVINTVNYMISILQGSLQEINKYELKSAVSNIKNYILKERAKLEDNDILKVLNLLKDENITEDQAKELWEESNNDFEQIAKVYNYVKAMKNKNKIETTVFAYLKSMVAPGKFNEPSKGKKLRFNDFPQRSYDYDNLEHKLLGWDDDSDEMENQDEIEENQDVNKDKKADDSVDLEINFDNLKLILEEQLTSLFGEVSYSTWLKNGVQNSFLLNNKIVLKCQNEFTIQIIEKKYKETITDIIKFVDENLELGLELEDK